MDKPPASAPTRVKPAIELDDQPCAAILEIARRLELVRAETNTYKKTRRGVATPTTATTKGSGNVVSGLGLRERHDVDDQHQNGSDGAAGDGAL